MAELTQQNQNPALPGQTQAVLDGQVQNSSTVEENKAGMFSQLGGLDVLRQISLILLLAITLAIAVFIMLWAQEPEYRPLGQFETQELIETLDFLDKNQLKYQLQGDLIKVPEADYQSIKLALARAGLDQTNETGTDYLSQDSGFGVSQRMEQARLKHSQEQNLARAIEELQKINRAKVILALPKENVFARRQQEPSATVVVNLRRGAVLKQEEVDSVVDLVASAVHALKPNRVTVTDQSGRLLSSGSKDAASTQARREQELVQQKELEYRQKIETILMPILGVDAFTAQVDVSMDFTAVEETSKRFHSEPTVRSEMTLERGSSSNEVGGVPGALSNQPPAASQIPQTLEEAQTDETLRLGSTHREQTRNYELDTTISHTRNQVGVIDRVSVSVAVDYKEQMGEEGVQRVPYSEAELANIRRLLEGSIGFSNGRGDQIEVVSFPFIDNAIEALPEPPFYEHPLFWRGVKLFAGLLAALVLFLTVVRPVLNRMLNKGEEEPQPGGYELAEIEDQYAADTLGMLTQDPGSYSYAEDGSIRLPDLHKDDDMLKAIRALVANEPELSTQVIKSWLTEDAPK
ncbi:flagellar M-ring protein [Paraferrimonas sedimenticola]|uniref:Flagellar M-ring protein n=2 Tax=Paraferrimonas sedimenticola TaxID=375674 RepID=A0AA37VSV8_9GAMM|nr:flagellar M-ring protein [Paraferrimonas sedimenticola]